MSHMQAQPSTVFVVFVGSSARIMVHKKTPHYATKLSMSQYDIHIMGGSRDIFWMIRYCTFLATGVI